MAMLANLVSEQRFYPRSGDLRFMPGSKMLSKIKSMVAKASRLLWLEACILWQSRLTDRYDLYPSLLDVCLFCTLKVWSWGVNDEGALGRKVMDVPNPEKPEEMLDREELESTPMVVDNLEKDRFRAVALAAGDNISVAIGADGLVKAWGSFHVSSPICCPSYRVLTLGLV
jgi:Regulator of chromosome condensation (RCC1) repeat